MKVKILRRGGYSIGQIDASGGEAFGSVMLYRNPEVNLEASSVGYIDTKKSELPAGVFGLGLISSLRLPGFVGDMVAVPSSSETTLAVAGVIDNSTHIKVNVNSKGQVLGGNPLLETDLPNLDWANIDTSKPTTLDGYGITDALRSSGGTISGSLKVSALPTDDQHLANLTYLDSVVDSGQGTDAPTGTVVYRTSLTTPTGFLRCNGSSVSKTAYANLYSVIGDQYSNGLAVGSGRPWEQQYLFNTSQTTALGSWTKVTDFPVGISYSCLAVTKNRVYVLGGFGGVSLSISTIYTAVINADGSIGAWSTAGNLPAVLSYSSLLVVRNKLYLFGGFDASNILATVRVAPINTDGTLGTWTTSTAMPSARYDVNTIVTSSRVYVIGGLDSNYATVNTVWYAPINTDGTLGAWVTGTPSPVPLNSFEIAVIKDKVFIFQSGQYYSVTINTDGSLGTWSAAIIYPGLEIYSKVFVTKNRIYFIGGMDGSTYNGKTVIYSAPINADGSLGSLTTGTALTHTVYRSLLFSTSSRLYTVGGYGTGDYTRAVAWTPLSGGLNDYSSYYSTIVLSYVDNNNFTLPAINPSMTNTYAYIKI